ncbi:hypothetical protein P7H17_18265 [Paenibacillus larvae]|nr:hypothetical protein [Paenibacillus larvae]MDT2255417.1 hypothetical protein [Paenibacillus larvae]MDT2265857.1 hypothetical protein [Paenibacillus larvae]MDT2287610.1 hypothetical protein [Paenibacillus larvae]
MIHYNRLLIFSLILCFCIFLGIELATKGMNEIQGPSVRADKRTDNTVKSAPPEVEGKPRMTEEEIREDERKKCFGPCWMVSLTKKEHPVRKPEKIRKPRPVLKLHPSGR